MGLKYQAVGLSGFPFDFIKQFIAQGYSVCVETGTYYAQTSIELSKHFSEVHTIEASEEIYAAALKNIKVIPNISAYCGDSRLLLPKILKNKQDSRVVFWLDAHYSSGNTYNNESPLMEEIDTINALCVDPIIIIDDARFVNMKYNDVNRYADLYDFVCCLHYKGRYISCYDDKFFAIPAAFKQQLDNYTQKASTVDRESMTAKRNITVL